MPGRSTLDVSREGDRSGSPQIGWHKHRAVLRYGLPGIDNHAVRSQQDLDTRDCGTAGYPAS
ncbi:MAG TPA: hypothetical protein VMV49_14975 [Candidatus Deferrimicrobium sp.]|nr:hypothetical protein [Candidatus Deferrimicrobium sp.]